MRTLHFILPFLLACRTEPASIAPVALDVISISDTVIDAGQDEVGAPDVAAPSQRILLIGDSQVFYMQVIFDRANVKKSNETVMFDSHPGFTILAMDRIFVAEMSKYPRLDEVIIFLGTNNWPFDKWQQPMDDILREVQRRNVKCLWVGPTEVYHKVDRVKALNKEIKTTIAGVCDFFDTQAAGIELQDGVHPSIEGGKKWLQEIWKAK